jgi:PIN domain-containing protein
VKYFFDNCICYKYAAMLRAIDVDVIALRDQFQQDISDTDLLSQLKGSGYVFVTADRRQARRRQEARAIIDAGLTAVFFEPFWSKMKLWPAAAWLVAKWEAIDSFSRNAKTGTCAEFNHNGKFALFQP